MSRMLPTRELSKPRRRFAIHRESAHAHIRTARTRELTPEAPLPAPQAAKLSLLDVQREVERCRVGVNALDVLRHSENGMRCAPRPPRARPAPSAASKM